MGSLAAIFHPSGRPDVRAAERMIRESPHRGDRMDSLIQGRCVLAVGWSEGRPDASLWASEGLAVAFCGVLDNIADLAGALGKPNVPGASMSPASVVAAAFREHGEGTPRRFRGVFSVAVTDGGRLLCFRDHLGFGTLYYTHHAGGSYVATEAKQVVAGSEIGRQPDLEVLERIYFQDMDDLTPSALRGVRRLPKATTLTVEPGRARLRRYWDPEPLLESARFGRHELQEHFDHLMGQAVARMLTGGDVVSLSGGIDSPAVAAYAAPEHLRLTGRPLGGLSAIYPEHPSVDERRYVELVAEHLGLTLKTYVQRATPLDRLDHWTRLADGPVPTVALPLYEEHYRQVRDLGYGTVLTGELAEFVADFRQYLLPYLLFRGRLSAVADQIRARRMSGASIRSLTRQLALALLPAPAVALRWRFDRAGIPAWLDRRRINAPAVRSIVPARHRWRKMQLGAFQGPGLSVEAEAMCQEVCGVRSRRPWADVDLWEFFLSLPADVKFPDNQSKTLVRHLLRGKVPDAILDRRDKTVFDESVMAHVDYRALRRWLVRPAYRLAGVDYALLEERLERQELELSEFMWAKDLASIHAFLSQW
jgi:asparagine synthase (glutamine-hydrolysing)